MAKASRRTRQRSRRKAMIFDDDIFEHAEERRRTQLSYARVFSAMMISLLLLYIPFLYARGSKQKEMKRDRKPFEEKVDAKLSENLFRRIYRMSRSTFYKLHSILEDDLIEAFYPEGGGKRKQGTSKYHIDTKTRLSIALRFFAGSDPADLMQIQGRPVPRGGGSGGGR